MKNKLGIIVPYRDRYKHLRKFIPYIQSYLDGKDIEYTIVVVEQDNASAFNRGTLCNIGFKQAIQEGCNYVVFHDVDMLPVDVDYSYSNVPVHLATYDIPFPSYFGGITLFPVDIFEKINGFSNLYWGWGFEDDDLRYRCVRNNVSFASFNIEKTLDQEYVTFNGQSSYAEIPNPINFNRDFSISLGINLGETLYSPDKDSDIFPILTIKGYDLKLSYSSFNRFYLQVFDKDTKYYDVFSNIITKSNNIIKLEYKRVLNRLSVYINEVLVGIISLNTQLYNYSEGNHILFGTDIEKKNFFKGTLNSLEIRQSNILLVSYAPSTLPEYRLEDLSGNNNHAQVYNVYMSPFCPPKNYYSYIPHRRSSILKYLPHRNNGFCLGVWKNKTTRWNQLRYNNEVQRGDHDNLEDGLSNLKFTLYGKIQDQNYIHLNVGI